MLWSKGLYEINVGSYLISFVFISFLKIGEITFFEIYWVLFKQKLIHQYAKRENVWFMINFWLTYLWVVRRLLRQRLWSCKRKSSSIPSLYYHLISLLVHSLSEICQFGIVMFCNQYIARLQIIVNHSIIGQISECMCDLE